MLNLLAKIVPGVLGNIATKTIETVKQGKNNEHDEMVERLRQVSSYMGENRTWWDSIVDGINRLVRPAFTFGTIGLFILAVIHPVEFHASMVSLASVPDPMWIILGTIVVFWFGEKKLNGLRKPKPPSAKEVEAILHSLERIKKLGVEVDDSGNK